VGTIDEAGSVGSAANRRAARQRRFWSAEEKRRIVAESFTPGASVSKVAQRYGLNANLLFTWRRQEARSVAVAAAISSSVFGTTARGCACSPNGSSEGGFCGRRRPTGR
jgi:transposase-like protein